LPEGLAEVWSGAARGADELAASWAAGLGLVVREFPADWARLGRRAGAVRTVELLRALPAGSLCVCFAPPGVRRPAAGSRARDFLSSGSRLSCGEALARGFSVVVVWACGSVSRLVPSPGPRPQGWFKPSRDERMDCATNDTIDHGEAGHDMTTWAFMTDAEAVTANADAVRLEAAPRNAEIDELVDSGIITEHEADMMRFEARLKDAQLEPGPRRPEVNLSGPRKNQIVTRGGWKKPTREQQAWRDLVRLRDKPWDDCTPEEKAIRIPAVKAEQERDLRARMDNASWRPGAGEARADKAFEPSDREANHDRFGDGARRSRHTLRGSAFEIGELRQCRSCGEPIYGVDFCENCSERVADSC